MSSDHDVHLHLLQAAVLKSMLEEGRAAGLKGFEQVRAHQGKPFLARLDIFAVFHVLKLKHSN